MPIPFVPQRGFILICDFRFGQIAPELGKERRIVVVSPRSYNRRHGLNDGRCVVVPFSGTAPEVLTPAHVEFPVGKYRTLTKPTWVICECVRSVSHQRLNRVKIGGINLNERLSDADMARIDDGLRHALGLVVEGD